MCGFFVLALNAHELRINFNHATLTNWWQQENWTGNFMLLNLGLNIYLEVSSEIIFGLLCKLSWELYQQYLAVRDD